MLDNGELFIFGDNMCAHYDSAGVCDFVQEYTGKLSDFAYSGNKAAIVCKNEVKRDGTIVHKHIVNMRFVLDERICDGYYFASAIKLFKYYVKNPELLLAPPDSISEDY